jgi:hypothetical protein
MVNLLGRILLRSAPQVPERTCPACGDCVAGDRSIAVRGMHFHQRCAGYRMRQIGVPRR